jgi:hypothetical protein
VIRDLPTPPAGGFGRHVCDFYFVLKKSSIDSPDWRTIERNVTVGISFLGEGTITVNLPFLYF